MNLCLISQPIAKVISRLVKPRVKPLTPGLQGDQFIHYTTTVPKSKERLILFTKINLTLESDGSFHLAK